MKQRRFKVYYQFSIRAKETYEILKELFPLQVLYAEYPYAKLLKKYYKDNKVRPEFQNQKLLSLTKLRADFVLPGLDIIVEVDGEQHFAPVRFGGRSFEEALDEYEEQKNRDFQKLLIAKEIEFKLIRVGFKDELSKDSLYERLVG